MAREKQEQEEARRKLEVSKIQIPLEQPAFSAVLGEKGIFEKRFLLSSCPLKLQVCVCACASAVFDSSLAFSSCPSAFWQSHIPFGTEELMSRELWGPQNALHVQKVSPMVRAGDAVPLGLVFWEMEVV